MGGKLGSDHRYLGEWEGVGNLGEYVGEFLWNGRWE